MFKRANHLSVLSVVGLIVAIGLGMGGLVSLVSAVTSPFTQTDWSNGDFSASSQVKTATAGQITLATPENLANPAFLTDVSSWSAVVATPSGWIEVPNNAFYSPPTGNFLVMQYEAKYDCTATPDGIGDTAATCSAPADSGLGLDYRDIVGFSASRVVSTPEGAPIVHFTQTQAIAACPTGSHLITNAEWMTLVRDIEAQAANWANGVPNSLVSANGGLKRGNVGITDSASYDGADPEQGMGRNSKAKHVLSNGAEIWDLSGNVWEWTSDTIMGADKPYNNTESG